jgi:hypothetical protein
MPRIVFCALCLAAAALAGDAVSASASMPWNGPGCYPPVIVDLQPETDGVVRIQATGNNDQSAAMAVTVQARRRQRVTLPRPNSSWTVELTITDQAGRVQSIPVRSKSVREQDLLIVDPDESASLKDLRTAIAPALAGVGLPDDRYRSSKGYPEERIDRIAADQLPDRWQCYPWWLTIGLTRSGEQQLDAGQRQALATWTRTGGALIVEDESQAAAWRAQGAKVTVGFAGAAALIKPRLADGVDDAPPVPGTDRVPVLGFVTVALVFAILVGPVNLWWVRRRGKRHLFLITTPVISAITCIALVLVSVLADGLGIRRTVVQAVQLDMQGRQAVAWTAVSYFAALPTSTIPLDPEDRIEVSGSDDQDGWRRRERTAQALTLTWGDAQIATGGWLPARINRSLRYVQARPENRRLLVEADGSGWRVTNGLGVGIALLAWKDGDGGLWTCAHLADGATASMEKQPGFALNGTGLITGIIEPGQPLPATRLDRLGPVGQQRPWEVFTTSRHGFQAVLDAPLLPVPGPPGTEIEPVRAWVFGDLPPAAPQTTNPQAR